MKTVAEIIDLVEEYGILCRYSKPDWHGKLAEIEAALKERETRLLGAISGLVIAARGAGVPHQDRFVSDAYAAVKAVFGSESGSADHRETA